MHESSDGWIKVYRSLLYSEIFQNEKLLKIFIWCLLKANHKENKVMLGKRSIAVKRGQFIFGRAKAAEELNIAPSTVWDYMKVLEDKKTIKIKSNNKYSLVTIENWRLYQKINKTSDNKLTTDQQQNDSSSTTNRQQIDTNKNEKNEKNNIYVETSNEYRLAKFLFEHIRKNNPKAKEPNFQKWAKTCDYILRLDKRDLEEVKEIIKWIHREDCFWNSVILSPQNLRNNYDRLVAQKRHDDKKENNNGNSNKQGYSDFEVI